VTRPEFETISHGMSENSGADELIIPNAGLDEENRRPGGAAGGF
jgi:hypothetical protein